MCIQSLSNDKLIQEYRNIKDKFVHAEPSNRKLYKLYGLILQEVRKRSFKTFRM